MQRDLHKTQRHCAFTKKVDGDGGGRDGDVAMATRIDVATFGASGF